MTGSEECDDGDRVDGNGYEKISGDGCSPFCKIEYGSQCENPGSTPSVCKHPCNPGKYWNDAIKMCSTCAAGTYKASFGTWSSQCQPCVAPNTIDAGHTSCNSPRLPDPGPNPPPGPTPSTTPAPGSCGLTEYTDFQDGVVKDTKAINSRVSVRCKDVCLCAYVSARICMWACKYMHICKYILLYSWPGISSRKCQACHHKIVEISNRTPDQIDDPNPDNFSLALSLVRSLLPHTE